jgi:UDP-N-acetylmuramoyl-tripeptide--D-alanyl-D-alanine ligase
LEHLEGFKDIEAVAKEESEVYLMAYRDSAMTFVNHDDPWLLNMSKRLNRKSTYSTVDSSCDIYVKILSEMPRLDLEIFVKGASIGRVTSHLGGAFNAQNIAAAVAAGIYYEVPADLILIGIAGYVPSMNRSQWIHTTDNKHILLDAYNANPSSMAAGIKSFATLQGTKTLLLGDMLELGEHGENEHIKIFEQIQELGFTDLFLVGDIFKNALPSYPFVFDNTDSLLAWLDTHPIQSEYVYIKGSRGIAMEHCLDHFKLS